MQFLFRLEGAPQAQATIEMLVSTTPIGTCSTPSKPSMIHVGLSLAPADALAIVIAPLQASKMSLGNQFQSLAVAPFIAPPLFIMPPFFASPTMPTMEQKEFERFMQLASSFFDGTPGDRAYPFLLESQG